ncbi:MAG: methylated-DNA--[protein]-cysteine S-methyltransferase [Saprospiraceae bacterium]|nr:methylated-DNA--[protein]-cysteine S-methyltransferase [Saprospiraceae bacterium]
MESFEENNIKYKITHFETPLGLMTAISEPEGIFTLDFSDSINLKSVMQNLKINPEVREDTQLVQVKKEIEEYFSGLRKEFTVRLSLHGTEFQKKVWTELMKIPFGRTRTYSQQAIALKDIKAIRAVASANGKNKIAVIVPCHRVIGSDGSLTGYAGGLWRKKWLLEFESSVESPVLFDSV